MKKPQILVNAVIAADGTIMRTLHRYDFKSYETQEGQKCFVDGGLDYTKFGGDCTPLTITDQTSFPLLRCMLMTKHMSKETDLYTENVPLFSLTDEQVSETIDNIRENNPSSVFLTIYKKELEYRKLFFNMIF